MFKGSLVALITPMDELGAVDKSSLRRLIEYHISHNTAGLIIVGTSGESATLDNHEHIDVIKRSVDIAAGRIPIIAGTGANSTKEAVWLTEQVSKLGIAGCLTVTPYYNKPMQQGLYQHFKTIAQSTAVPQILYNVPSRTGCDLQVDTIAQLAEFDNIIGLKEASGDLKRVKEIRHAVKKPFSLLSGDDLTFLDFMQLGGDGNISVTANVAAKEMAQICSLALQGEFQQAQQLQNTLLALHKSLFMESNPIPIKWACYRMGLIDHDTLRLPLTALSSNVQHIVENALKLAGLL